MSPGVSAESYRAFSLNGLKENPEETSTRTGHECLSDLAVLAAEQDLVKALDIEDLIDKFDAAHGGFSLVTPSTAEAASQGSEEDGVQRWTVGCNTLRGGREPDID
ncbi:hypothetical protein ANN_24301 [Periplaneta americana]|uniref:Uncharacterized protein n=1 Tax=Periplaneta americana TaxID=6978 RepID=A0ABQ8S2Y1_PERAM|nr:hypothetical protein ANN_24301 [Periplaneta americana]